MTAPTRMRTGVPIDPRIRERRVAVQRAEGRRRLRVLLAALSALAAAGAGLAATRSPLLDVDKVVIRGAEHTPRADLVAAAGTGDNPLLIEYDTAAAARRIERLPWVRSAHVDRKWPDTVRIAIVERDAVAALPATQGWALLDRDGRIVDVGTDDRGLVAIAATPLRRRAGRDVPTSLRPGLAVAAALAAEDRAVLRAHVKAVLVGGRSDAVQLGLQLTDGGTVQLGGSDDLQTKLVAAATVLESVAPASIDTLDVRVPNAPVLRRRAPPKPAPVAGAKSAAKPASGQPNPAQATTTTTRPASGPANP